MAAKVPTPRADQVAAQWGKSHPLYRKMRALDLLDARDRQAIAAHTARPWCGQPGCVHDDALADPKEETR